jgi:hypothetical protein
MEMFRASWRRESNDATWAAAEREAVSLFLKVDKQHQEHINQESYGS